MDDNEQNANCNHWEMCYARDLKSEQKPVTKGK